MALIFDLVERRTTPNGGAGLYRTLPWPLAQTCTKPATRANVHRIRGGEAILLQKAASESSCAQMADLPFALSHSLSLFFFFVATAEGQACACVALRRLALAFSVYLSLSLSLRKQGIGGLSALSLLSFARAVGWGLLPGPRARSPPTVVGAIGRNRKTPLLTGSHPGRGVPPSRE